MDNTETNQLVNSNGDPNTAEKIKDEENSASRARKEANFDMN